MSDMERYTTTVTLDGLSFLIKNSDRDKINNAIRAAGFEPHGDAASLILVATMERTFIKEMDDAGYPDWHDLYGDGDQGYRTMTFDISREYDMEKLTLKLTVVAEFTDDAAAVYFRMNYENWI